MNMKKTLFVALAALTAASLSAAAVSAATVGGSTGGVSSDSQTFIRGAETTFSVDLEDAQISLTLFADTDIVDSVYTLNSEIVTATPDLESAIDNLGLNEVEVLKLYMTDSNGENVNIDNARASIFTKFNTIYAYDVTTGKLTKLDASYHTDDDVIFGGALSFNTAVSDNLLFVLANTEEPSVEPSQDDDSKVDDNSQTSTNNGGNTDNNSVNSNTGKGDSTVTTGDTATATTVAVFGVVGLVALGTAVVAAKTKKSSK